MAAFTIANATIFRGTVHRLLLQFYIKKRKKRYTQESSVVDFHLSITPFPSMQNLKKWVRFIHKIWVWNFKGVLHPWTLFLKILCIFSKNKATLDKVSHGSDQKCSKELKNHSLTSVFWSYSEKCAKINMFHVLSHKSITTWVSEIPVQLLGCLESYLLETYLTCYKCVIIFEKKSINSHKTGQGCNTPLNPTKNDFQFFICFWLH